MEFGLSCKEFSESKADTQGEFLALLRSVTKLSLTLLKPGFHPQLL